MTNLEISTIANSALRQAAEKADSHDGENGYNTKLEISEFSVFVKQAYKRGCSEEEIFSVAEQLGVKIGEKNEASEILTEMQELNKTKTRLNELKNQLDKRVASVNDMKDDYESTKTKSSTGEDVGFWAGGVAGAAASLKIPVPHPLLKLVTAAAGFLFGAASGTIGGMGIDRLVDTLKPDSYEVKVQKKQIDDYEQSAIKPLKEIIAEIEQTLKDKEDAFYE